MPNSSIAEQDNSVELYSRDFDKTTLAFCNAVAAFYIAYSIKYSVTVSVFSC
jgi:hypothetical protein